MDEGGAVQGSTANQRAGQNYHLPMLRTSIDATCSTRRGVSGPRLSATVSYRRVPIFLEAEASNRRRETCVGLTMLYRISAS